MRNVLETCLLFKILAMFRNVLQTCLLFKNLAMFRNEECLTDLPIIQKSPSPTQLQINNVLLHLPKVLLIYMKCLTDLPKLQINVYIRLKNNVEVCLHQYIYK